MSALQKIDFGSFNNLLPAERKILELARSGPQVGALTYGQRIDLATKILLDVGTRLGQPTKEGEYKQMLTYLEKDINKFPDLTRDEILEALDMGMDGRFTEKGQPIIFNLSRFVQWVEAWVELHKAPAMTKVSRAMHQEVEDQFVELDLRDSLNSKFLILYDALGEMLAGRRFDDRGNSIYELLMMIGDGETANVQGSLIKHALSMRRLGDVVAQGEEACLEFINEVRVKIQKYLEEHGD